MASRPSSRSERAPLLRGWALWPQVLVRGAGFSFAWLDEVVTREGTAALREVAKDLRFREAVTWQNRAAVSDGLDSLLRKSDGASDARTRKKELLVVRYLQRYCAKNDTIGFFGPVGWARWGDGGSTPSPRVVEARAVFPEPWMARELADAALATPAGQALGWVRVPGHVRIEGRVAISPTQRVALEADEARLLLEFQRSGPRRWKELRGSRLALARRLVELGLLRLSIPVGIGPRPLAALGKRGAAMARQVRALAEPGLAGKLEALERDFTAATAHAPARHAGQAYGGRGLVYEECRRAVSLELSEAMRAQVAAPLRLVLELARWFTFRVARTLEQLLRGQRGGVPLPVFWQATAPLFAGQSPPVLRGARRALREVCARLWASGPACAVEDAQRLVARLRAPHPGWPGARHHAPDLLWAAPSAEAMLAGAGPPVLGELHPGVTPFSTLSVLALAPDRRALERQW
ncbi:MAG: lantibiotic dehydratase family protein, partial [Myxococcaceae bacterium]|nr:lantibiotic dehydratase family protein [Myxococcaceae bacterium]